MDYECVKCGHENSEGLEECGACKWPLRIEALQITTHRIMVVTQDTSCINARQIDSALNQLEKWATEGKLELRRAEEMMKELRGVMRQAKARSIARLLTNFFCLGSSILGGGDILAGPEMTNVIKKILFPSVKALSQNQQHDVNHLAQHVRSGGDIFTTLNTNDFIKNGRQETLQRYGIWVFTPKELVALLEKLYEWN